MCQGPEPSQSGAGGDAGWGPRHMTPIRAPYSLTCSQKSFGPLWALQSPPAYWAGGPPQGEGLSQHGLHAGRER